MCKQKKYSVKRGLFCKTQLLFGFFMVLLLATISAPVAEPNGTTRTRVEKIFI
ncbi:MAG: hypothetical protein ACFFB2_19460 [Promethearchaeota archaeon]